jgi:hypothetical protein
VLPQQLCLLQKSVRAGNLYQYQHPYHSHSLW